MNKLVLSKVGKGLAVMGVGSGILFAGLTWTGHSDLEGIWNTVNDLATNFYAANWERTNLERDLSILQEKYDNALTTIGVSEDEIERLRSEITQIEAVLSTTQTSLESEKLSVEASTTEVMRLESELSTANEEVQDLHGKIKEHIESLPTGINIEETLEKRMVYYIDLLIEDYESKNNIYSNLPNLTGIDILLDENKIKIEYDALITLENEEFFKQAVIEPYTMSRAVIPLLLIKLLNEDITEGLSIIHQEEACNYIIIEYK